MGLLQNLRGTNNGTAGEMIQGLGMALERGVPIGLGRMPGMPSFGGQAKVGKPQIVDNLTLLPEQGEIALCHVARMHEDERQEQQGPTNKEKKSVRFSQRIIPIIAGCPIRSTPSGSDGAAKSSLD